MSSAALRLDREIGRLVPFTCFWSGIYRRSNGLPVTGAVDAACGKCLSFGIVRLGARRPVIRQTIPRGLRHPVRQKSRRFWARFIVESARTSTSSCRQLRLLEFHAAPAPYTTHEAVHHEPSRKHPITTIERLTWATLSTLTNLHNSPITA